MTDLEAQKHLFVCDCTEGGLAEIQEPCGLFTTSI